LFCYFNTTTHALRALVSIYVLASDSIVYNAKIHSVEELEAYSLAYSLHEMAIYKWKYANEVHRHVDDLEGV